MNNPINTIKGKSIVVLKLALSASFLFVFLNCSSPIAPLNHHQFYIDSTLCLDTLSYKGATWYYTPKLNNVTYTDSVYVSKITLGYLDSCEYEGIQ